MTLRAQAFAIAGIIGLSLGLIRGQWALSWLSLASLLWLLVEWLAFYWQARVQISKLALVRLVNGESSTGRSLWSDRIIDMEIRWNKKLPWFGVTLDVIDVVPENLEVLEALPSKAQRPPTKSSQRAASRQSRRFKNSWPVGGLLEYIETSSAMAPNEIRFWRKHTYPMEVPSARSFGWRCAAIRF